MIVDKSELERKLMLICQNGFRPEGRFELEGGYDVNCHFKTDSRKCDSASNILWYCDKPLFVCKDCYEYSLDLRGRMSVHRGPNGEMEIYIKAGVTF